MECINQMLHRPLKVFQRWAGELNGLLDHLPDTCGKRDKVGNDSCPLYCGRGGPLVPWVAAEFDNVRHASQ